MEWNAHVELDSTAVQGDQNGALLAGMESCGNEGVTLHACRLDYPLNGIWTDLNRSLDLHGLTGMRIPYLKRSPCCRMVSFFRFSKGVENQQSFIEDDIHLKRT